MSSKIGYWILGFIFSSGPFLLAGAWLLMMFSYFASLDGSTGLEGFLIAPAMFGNLPWPSLFEAGLLNRPDLIEFFFIFGFIINALLYFGIFSTCHLLVKKVLGDNQKQRVMTFIVYFIVSSVFYISLISLPSSAIATSIFHPGRLWILRGITSVERDEAKELCENMSRYYFRVPSKKEAINARTLLKKEFRESKVVVEIEKGKYGLLDLENASIEAISSESEVAVVCVCSPNFSDRRNCASLEMIEVPSEPHFYE
jgi:hypothetical protein